MKFLKDNIKPSPIKQKIVIPTGGFYQDRDFNVADEI